MSGLKRVFASELRKQRKRLSLTQAQLAEQLDLSIDMIGRLERANVAPSFETIERLCQIFDISPATLFGGSDGAHTDATSKELRNLLSRLKGLTPAELGWIDRIVLAALARDR